MVDFSIKALITPLVPITNRSFDKITNYIVEKHPGAYRNVVNRDLKVIMFNAATSLMVATVAIGYFKKIAVITAVACAVLFYLVRRIIAETISTVELPKDTSSQVNDLKKSSFSFFSAKSPDASDLQIKEKVTFYQGDDLAFGSLIVLRWTHYPLPKMIGMIFTRSS